MKSPRCNWTSHSEPGSKSPAQSGSKAVLDEVALQLLQALFNFDSQVIQKLSETESVMLFYVR